MSFCGVCGIPIRSEVPEAPMSGGLIADHQPASDWPTAPQGADPWVGSGPTGGTGEYGAEGGTSSKHSKKPWGLKAVVIISVAAVVGVFLFLTIKSDSTHPIQEAAETCFVETNLGDDGSSITFDTEGTEDYSGDDYSDVACTLEALNVPDHVVAQMDSTRALDGTLSATWDEFEASWNYHPDSGMNLTIYGTD